MYENFYDIQYKNEEYASVRKMEEHPFYKTLKKYLLKYDEKYFQKDKVKCLEIGSGRGALQDITEDYTGVDYSNSVEQYYQKNFVKASATDLPFKDNTFDLIWSYAVLEHIPNPELALKEMLRVIRGGWTYNFVSGMALSPVGGKWISGKTILRFQPMGKDI